ncbi:MAG: CsbD family protein [Enterococcus sp.]
MGNIKNKKDEVVGVTKEKLGELLNNEELEAKGKQQNQLGKEHSHQLKKRIEEIEDEQAETDAHYQDLTRELPDNERREEPESSAHTLNREKLEEERMKHYTGIEDKL